MSSVNETISNFISVAERFLGVREGTPQHSIILALYNSSKPKDEYQMGPNDPWCAAFVGAVSGGCGLQNVIPISASCSRMKSRLEELGAQVVGVPQPGDIVFYDWNGDGDHSEHVGIVTSVNDGSITTIEGNYSDAVGHRTFKNLPAIFYRPNWEGNPVQSSEPIQWDKYREYYSELTWDEKNEIKTFPQLQTGSRGIYVKIMQDMLGLHPDGDFGSETRDQLLLYQKEKQLEVDGICGRQTWSSFFA